ncbi:hypothetical protein J45TS6_13510 [Paenibacillus sp. J45TS6]|nr:hypothetical protein J45TS6_13510 [Paenibacillus sp. J45TS6]
MNATLLTKHGKEYWINELQLPLPGILYVYRLPSNDVRQKHEGNEHFTGWENTKT